MAGKRTERLGELVQPLWSIRSRPPAVQPHLAAVLDDLEAVAVELRLMQPSPPGGMALAVVGMQGRMYVGGAGTAADGRCSSQAGDIDSALSGSLTRYTVWMPFWVVCG